MNGGEPEAEEGGVVSLIEQVGRAMEPLGPVGWIATVLFLALICAALVLAIVLIRLVLVKTRALQTEPNASKKSPVAVSVSSASVAPTHRNAAAVPPENPHSPPTPVGTPRIRA